MICMAKWNKKKKYTNLEIEERNMKKTTYFFSKTMKHQVMLMILSVTGVSLIVGGSAYAVFTSLSSSDYNTVSIGSLEMSYTEDENSVINLESAYPIEDSEGLASKGYSFSIRNTGSLASKYDVYIGSDGAMIQSDKCKSNLLDYKNIKINVNNGTTTTLQSLATGKFDSDGYEIYKISSGSLQPGETKKFNVKMWINIASDNSVLGKHFHGKVLVNGENYQTYETDALRVWYDGKNNTSEGENTTAKTWYDLSGNNNNSSTFIGSNTWKDAGLTLNGSGVVPLVGNINSEYTLSMVVKPNKTGTNPYLIYGSNFPSLYLDSSKNYALAFQGQNLSSVLNPNTVLNTDKPSLITVTYSNNTLSFYLNSALITTMTTTTLPASTATIYLGGNNSSSNLTGSIYSFMLYDKALSEEQISAKYIIDANRFNMK